MLKTFIHLGAHKTATTFTQQNLVASRPAFEAQGWKALWLQRDRPDIYQSVGRVREGKARGNDIELVDRYFEDIRTEPANVFLSTETTLGAMNISASQGVIYPHSREMMQMLKTKLEGREIRVAYCIRNFADFVESSYSFLVMKGTPSRFGKFYEKVNIKNLSWLKIIDELADVFGKENMYIWTYEDFKRNSTAYFLRLLDVAGLDVSGLSAPIRNPRNISISPEATRIAVRWNTLIKTTKDVSKEEREKLTRDMMKLLAKLNPVDGKELLNSEQRAQLKSAYAEELATIQSKYADSMLKLTSLPDSSSEKKTESHA